MNIVMGATRNFALSVAWPLLTAAVALVGCTAALPLPHDSGLSKAFNNELGERASDLGIMSLRLVCNTNKGSLDLEVVSQKTLDSKVVQSVASATPCSEDGVLAEATLGNGYIYSVSSKHVYEPELVKAEWRKAIDTLFGSLAYNAAATQLVEDKDRSSMVDRDIYDVEFTCGPKAKVVHYRGFVRGDYRQGETSTACPEAPEKSGLVARLQRPGPADYLEQPRQFEYRVIAVKALTPELTQKLVDEFVQAVGPHKF